MNAYINRLEYLARDAYEPQNRKVGSGRIKKHLKEGLRKVATFIYETPASVVALMVSGVALLIIFPKVAPPFLGLAGSAILTRLVVIIIYTVDHKGLMKSKEKIYEFNEKHPKLQWIAFLVAVVICALLSPISGFVISVSIGIYKGMIVEIDIYKYKQELRREELKNPIPEARVGIIHC